DVRSSAGQEEVVRLHWCAWGGPFGRVICLQPIELPSLLRNSGTPRILGIAEFGRECPVSDLSARHYLDDEGKKAGEMHPVLMQAFNAFPDNYHSLVTEIEKLSEPLILRELAAVKAEGKAGKYLARRAFLSARALVRISDTMGVKRTESLEQESFSMMLEQLQPEIAELEQSMTAGESSPFDSDIRNSLAGVMLSAKRLRRRAKSGDKYSKSERRNLGTAGGWMVKGSAESVRENYSSLLRSQRTFFRASRVLD
ncbi:MAG: YiiG family protein, partial [Myxococcales bacterium]|nr:YiiG family protein [Myxococcales bacterium]